MAGKGVDVRRKRMCGEIEARLNVCILLTKQNQILRNSNRKFFQKSVIESQDFSVGVERWINEMCREDGMGEVGGEVERVR